MVVAALDQHRRRHLAAPALGVEQLGHGVGVEGVGGDAVDGVGGQHHQLAALECQSGGLDGGLPLLRGGGREALGCHGPIVPGALSRSGDGPRDRGGRAPRAHRPVAVKTAGAEPPLHVGVLGPHHSPGPQQHRGALLEERASRRDRRAPEKSARCGSWSRASAATDSQAVERDVRRVADHDVDLVQQVVEGVGHGRPAAARRRCRPGCGRPSAWAASSSSTA